MATIMLAFVVGPFTRAFAVLPRPELPFKGKVATTSMESTPDFPKGIEAPKGAPMKTKTMTVTHVALAQRGNPLTKLGSQTPDEMIATFMREHQIPGMTLAIVQAPYISRLVGYGT